MAVPRSSSYFLFISSKLSYKLFIVITGASEGASVSAWRFFMRSRSYALNSLIDIYRGKMTFFWAICIMERSGLVGVEVPVPWPTGV